MSSCSVIVGSAAPTPPPPGKHPYRSVARSAFRGAGSITESVRAPSSRPPSLQLQKDHQCQATRFYALFAFLAPHGKVAVPATSDLGALKPATPSTATSALS